MYLLRGKLYGEGKQINACSACKCSKMPTDFFLYSSGVYLCINVILLGKLSLYKTR